MKRLLILMSLTLPLVAADVPAFMLPHDGFGALLFYNQAGHPRVNGSFAYFTHIPDAPVGTYLYNSFDFVSMGKGQIVGVPETGVMQNIANIGEYVHLFGLMQAGVSYAPKPTGTDVSAAFGGGGGVSYDIGKSGFKAVFVAKAIQAQGYTTLVGGAGIAWGH